MNGCQNLCYKIALWTPVNSSEMNRVKVGFTHSTSSMGTVQVPNTDRVTGGFSPLSWRAVLSVPRPSLEVERRWPPSAEAGSGHPCPARCGWCDGTEGWGGEGVRVLGCTHDPLEQNHQRSPVGHSGLARLLSEQPSNLCFCKPPSLIVCDSHSECSSSSWQICVIPMAHKKLLATSALEWWGRAARAWWRALWAPRLLHTSLKSLLKCDVQHIQYFLMWVRFRVGLDWHYGTDFHGMLELKRGRFNYSLTWDRVCNLYSWWKLF